MKRVILHLLFWLVYLAFRALIEYLWGKGSLPGFSDGQFMRAALQASTLESLPEILFAYYFTYCRLKYLLQKSRWRFLYVLEVILAMVVCTYIVRLTYVHIIAPHVYSNRVPVSSHFEFKRFVLVAFYFIATTGLFVAVKTVKYQLILKEKERNLLQEKLETELKMLRSQTNPHFLFNTLNNIYSLALKKSDKTPEAIMKLSDLLSFMLYGTNKERVAIAEEVKIIEDYIELEKLRYTERLTVVFEKNIDEPQQPIAPLLLLPLVENAFKHGVSETRHNSFVYINLNLKQSILSFNIENTLEVEKTKNGNTPIGLNNLQRQLQLMYKEHNVDITKTLHTFKVSVTIHLDSYGKV